MIDPRRRGELGVTAALIVLGLLVAAVATHDAWRRVGQPSPGCAVMENLLVVVGGGERGRLLPFDKVVALHGRVLTSAADITAEVHRHPPGTVLHYLVARGHQLLEIDVPTRTVTVQWFQRFVLEALIPGLLNVASRLAGVGEDDAVHIGPETRRRLGDGFVVEDMGEQRLKNVEEPVRVFRVVASAA